VCGSCAGAGGAGLSALEAYRARGCRLLQLWGPPGARCVASVWGFGLGGEGEGGRGCVEWRLRRRPDLPVWGWGCTLIDGHRWFLLTFATRGRPLTPPTGGRCGAFCTAAASSGPQWQQRARRPVCTLCIWRPAFHGRSWRARRRSSSSSSSTGAVNVISLRYEHKRVRARNSAAPVECWRCAGCSPLIMPSAGREDTHTHSHIHNHTQTAAPPPHTRTSTEAAATSTQIGDSTITSRTHLSARGQKERNRIRVCTHRRNISTSTKRDEGLSNAPFPPTRGRPPPPPRQGACMCAWLGAKPLPCHMCTPGTEGHRVPFPP
jgi:hypothetical protein